MIFHEEKENTKQLIDVVNVKLDYIESNYINKKIKVLIWGASNAGLILKKILKTRCFYEVVGFIDKYKSGIIDGLSIFKPDQIENLKFDHIFIASSPGKEEIIRFLNGKGMNFKENYFYLL